MRIETAISVVTLAVSTAALALVLWLVITQPWVVEEPAPVVAIPTFTDDEVLNAVRGHLMTPGYSPLCTVMAHQLSGRGTVRQDPSNPDKYLVIGGMGGTWTFIGSLAKVIPTSTGPISVQGC
jgi:hypothetical protein